MAPIPPPHEHGLHGLDWEALRQGARRRLRARMSGFSAEEIEDSAQDVVGRMVAFVQRHGRPDSPEGLLMSLVRAVASNEIRRRQRERALQSGEIATWLDEPSVDGAEEDVLEEYRRIVFHMREYFRLKRSGCLPLADAKSNGVSLKEHAARERLSYEQVRQAWSRCVRLIHEAMRKNRLRIAWLTPDREDGPDE